MVSKLIVIPVMKDLLRIPRRSERSKKTESVRSGKISWFIDFVGSTGHAAIACVPG